MYNTATTSLTRALASSILLLSMLLLVCPGAKGTYRGKNGRVVFVSNIGGTNQVYTMNPDGSDMVQITNLPPTQNVAMPDFSPDGKRIVFSTDLSGNFELYVVNSDGTGLDQLTNTGFDKLFARWSPDGSQLVFMLADELTTRIAIMRADGAGHPTVLTSDMPWECYQPEFSPDGKHIVFASQSGGLVSAVWIMKADGRQKRQLTAAELKAGGPDYSPDGQNVVLYSQQNTALPASVYAMRPDGSNLRLLAGPVALYPTYSPDGTKILFSGGPTLDQAINLYTMNGDGTEITQIGSNLLIGDCDIGNCLFPDWGASPDGPGAPFVKDSIPAAPAVEPATTETSPPWLESLDAGIGFSTTSSCILPGRACSPNGRSSQCCGTLKCKFNGGSTRVGYVCK